MSAHAIKPETEWIYIMPEDWKEASTAFKDILISLMSAREGTDIENFAKIFGLDE